MTHFDGNEVQRRREARGLDRTALAARIGRSCDTVRGYETGRAFPPPAVLGRLADVLGCELADLFTGDRVAS